MWRNLLAVVVFVAVMFAWLTRPVTSDLPDLDRLQADVVNGELLFYAGSCAACHETDLSGGLELESPFGVFRVPNISSDPDSGIGDWSRRDFLNAMLRGVSPEGQHYYPSFPYTSYAHMTVQDLVDLKGYLDTLPPVVNTVGEHDLGFPWNIRRGIGLWKKRYLDELPHLQLPEDTDPKLLRGRYLVEGPGHCTECHTPRDRFGGLETGRWLAGAPSLEGEGKVPNITPSPGGLGDWSTVDIIYYLETGFDPDFDTVGGSMVKVQENLARLTASDREAIVSYLQALKPLPSRAD